MIIYKTTNIVNGKIYIGQSHGLDKTYLGGGTILKKALKKYGRKNFKFEVIESNISDQTKLTTMKKLIIMAFLALSVAASAQKVNSINSGKSVNSINSVDTYSISSVQSLSNTNNKPGEGLNSIQNLSNVPYSNVKSVQTLSNVTRQDSIESMVTRLRDISSQLKSKE